MRRRNGVQPYGGKWTATREGFDTAVVESRKRQRGPRRDTTHLEDIVNDRLGISVAVAALLLAFVGIYQRFLDDTPAVGVPFVVALVTAYILATLAAAIRYWPELIAEINPHLLVTIVAAIIISNPVAYILSTGVAYPTIGTVLVIVAIGALVPYPITAIALAGGLNLFVIVCAMVMDDQAAVSEVILQLLKADAVSIVLALAWRRTEQRLRQSNTVFRTIATVDELTGLLNRRGLAELSPPLLDRAAGRGDHVLVGFVDIDGLKQINDINGHAVGDQVIARVGAVLRGTLCEGGLGARIGGDEFVVIAAAPSEHQLYGYRDSVINAFTAVPCTVTVGWAMRPAVWSVPLESLVAEADGRMLLSKPTPQRGPEKGSGRRRGR